MQSLLAHGPGLSDMQSRSMQASRKSLALQNLLADAASGTFFQGNLVGNQLLPKCHWGILQAGLALKPVRKPLDTSQRGEWQSVTLCLHQPRAPSCPGPSVKAVKGEVITTL